MSCPAGPSSSTCATLALATCTPPACPPPAAQQIISALRLIRGEDGTGRGLQKIQQLHDNSNWFRKRLKQIGCTVLGDNDSPVMVRGQEGLLRLACCSRVELLLYMAGSSSKPLTFVQLACASPLPMSTCCGVHVVLPPLTLPLCPAANHAVQPWQDIGCLTPPF